jgi:phosphosulfolactate phosphohydrolase-like enzyme
MNWNDRVAGEDDPVFAQALRNFKASVDAWSQAAMNRPRTTVLRARHSWRMAAGWALGCVLAAGSVAGALHERQHKQELARIAAAKAAAQKAAQERLVAEQQSASQMDQDLLATVDNDISRAVPAAMEPLAQMMDLKQAADNGTQ